MRFAIPLSLILAARAMPQPAAPDVSISGMVKEANTGKPLANYLVSTSVHAAVPGNPKMNGPEIRQVKVMTDDHGRYRLSGLPPGQYRIDVNSPESFAQHVVKNITLGGRDLDDIDFTFVLEGAITGKVLDENKEAIPGMMVFLISREYYLGTLGYFFKSTAFTNDRGEYKLAHVAPAHPYFIMVEKRVAHLPAHSDAPLNPRLRKRVPMRTWYPNLAVKEGAIAVSVGPSETLQGVDIEVKKSPSYCIDGTLVSSSGAGALQFWIEAQQPSSGVSAGGGMYVMESGGTTSADGQFRICDLYPGTYRLMANEASADPNRQPPLSYIATNITISDRDLNNLRIAAIPAISLDGEVVWEGDPPRTPVGARVSLFLEPLLRSHFGGEKTDTRADIPSTFSLPGLLLDDYSVRTSLSSPGLYVKDVTYAGDSVRFEPLRLGSALGNGGLRVTVGSNGGTIAARVVDKDGNPVADMRILLMPAEVRSEAMVQAMLLTGTTDQLGQYKSATLAPGKYFIAASNGTFDATPESIDKLWRSRGRFQEIELAPNGSPQVTLEPIKFDP